MEKLYSKFLFICGTWTMSTGQYLRQDTPALEGATHCPKALASLFLHGIYCSREHVLVVVVQLIKDVLCLCLQELQVGRERAVQAILKISQSQAGDPENFIFQNKNLPP